MNETCVVCHVNGQNLTSLSDDTKSIEGTKLVEMIEIHEKLKDCRDSGDVFFICDFCIKKLACAHQFLQSCSESPVKLKKRRLSNLVDTYTQTESQRCTLIVDNIDTESFRHIKVSEITSLFATYGDIKNVSMHGRPQYDGTTFARITYETEGAALRAFEAAQRGEIKYNKKTLVSTLVSKDNSPIHSLSDDCLQKVFSCLPVDDRLTVELVCKRWYRNCLQTYHNATVCHDALDESVYEDQKKIFFRCGCYLRHLRFCQSEGDRSVFPLMRKYCRNLESLAIFCYRTTRSQFRKLNKTIKQCEDLRRLFLGHLNENFDFDTLNSLPQEMVEIHLDSGRFTDDSNILSAHVDLSRFKNLQALSLFRLNFDSNDLNGIGNLEHLVQLRLEHSHYTVSSIEPIQNFKRLEHLAIPNSNIDDTFLINVLSNNKNIKNLDISDNLLLTERSLLHLPQLEFLKHLQVKNLMHLTDAHLSALHRLETLNCSGCHLVKDWGLMILIDSAEELNWVKADNTSVTRRLIASAAESIDTRKSSTRLNLLLNENLLLDREIFEKSQKFLVCDGEDYDGSDMWDDWYIK